MELPVMEHIGRAINLLKTVIAYRTAPNHADGPYYLDQVGAAADAICAEFVLCPC
jgi:hypothetical protein